MARPAADCGPEELWRGQLEAELTLLGQLQRQVRVIERPVVQSASRMTIAEVTERIRRVVFSEVACGDVAEDLTLPSSCGVVADVFVKRALGLGAPAERLAMVRTPDELDELETSAPEPRVL